MAPKIATKQPAPRPGGGSSVAEGPPRLAFPALLVGGIAIGFSPLFVRLSELGPVATGFYRLFLALPLLCLWMRWEERRAAEERGRPTSTLALDEHLCRRPTF